MPDVAGSARLLQAKVRVEHGIAQTGEEARAFLQGRIARFAAALFWSFVALVVFLLAVYARYPENEPRYQHLVYLTAAISLGLLALIWRFVLDPKKQRSVELLHAIDFVITVGSGFTFGIVAPLAFDLHAAAYTCLLYESFTVFTRALLIPSTGKRTLVVSSLAFVPIIAGAIVLAVITDGTEHELEIPGLAFVAGDILYNAVAVLLATRGSSIIYDLRTKADKLAQLTQLGQYTLLEKIGKGGMGEVYKARHAFLKRQTAIKLLPELSLVAYRRFEEEVQRTSQLTHANTISVFDFGRSQDGRPYYAMEYLYPGLDLGRLVQHGPVPAARAVRILVQVAGALQEAHDAGIIHRDIKPGNIMLCERGGVADVAKVLDFGLVQEIRGELPQTLMGTPEYLAPELIQNRENVSVAVDIYALGAVGYFLLAGRHVFLGDTREVMDHQVKTAPKPLSELGRKVVPELEAVIMRCLEKDPAKRYASATELAEALEAIRSHPDGDPPFPDWDPPRARAWWAEYRKKVVATPSTDSPTITVNIDLGQRTTG